MQMCVPLSLSLSPFLFRCFLLFPLRLSAPFSLTHPFRLLLFQLLWRCFANAKSFFLASPLFRFLPCASLFPFLPLATALDEFCFLVTLHPPSCTCCLHLLFTFSWPSLPPPSQASGNSTHRSKTRCTATGDAHQKEHLSRAREGQLNKRKEDRTREEHKRETRRPLKGGKADIYSHKYESIGVHDKAAEEVGKHAGKKKKTNEILFFYRAFIFFSPDWKLAGRTNALLLGCWSFPFPCFILRPLGVCHCLFGVLFSPVPPPHGRHAWLS